LVAALVQGRPLNITIDSPTQYKSTQKYTGEPSCGGFYCPKNAAKGMAGVHTMYSGFGESVNTFFVQLEEMATVKASVEAAEKLGIVFRARDWSGRNQGEALKKDGSLSFTLGVADVTPLDMANSYATIAAHGKRCEPLPVLRIVDRDGKELKAAAAPRCQQAIPADVADAAADAARCPVGDGARGECARANGVTASRVGQNIDRPIAGKSGTTDSNRAAWFVGFTPNLAASAFVTNPDDPKMSVGDDRHRIPVSIFIGAMNAGLAGLPVLQFTQPTDLRVNGVRVPVPNVDGLDPGDAKRRLERAGFKARINSEKIPSKYPLDRVAKTSPNGGGSASKGGVIAIFVSNGQPDPKDPGGIVPPFPGRGGGRPGRGGGGGGLPPAIVPFGD
jgi:membrane carboxypeptidase/penicillin-binding protein